jgi:hypothetical protein
MLIGIFGTGRNGSTLITRLLDGLSNTYVHPIEATFFSAFEDLASKKTVTSETKHFAKTTPLLHLNSPVKTSLLLPHYSYHKDDISNTYLSQLENNSIPSANEGEDPISALSVKHEYSAHDFVKSFLKAFSRWIEPDKDLDNFLFKSIEVPYIVNYEESFPDMRFIHIIRNPLDVYGSLVRATREKINPARKPSWYLGGDNLMTIIVKRWIPHAQFIMKKKQSDRHYVIRYEDLVAEPVRWIGNICKWLELSPPNDPTKLTVLGGKSVKRLSQNVGKVGVETPIEVIGNTKEFFKHDEYTITESERELIIFLTYEYARELGYFEGMSMPDKWMLFKKWVVPMKWEIRHSKNLRGLAKSLLKIIERRLTITKELIYK